MAMPHAGWTHRVPKFCLHCSRNFSRSSEGLGLREFGGVSSLDRPPAVLRDQGALSGEEWDWGLCVELWRMAGKLPGTLRADSG